MASFPSTSARMCTQEKAAGTVLVSGDAVQEAQLPSGLFAGGSTLPT